LTVLSGYHGFAITFRRSELSLSLESRAVPEVPEILCNLTYSKAGFKDISTERLNAIFEFTSAEDFTRFQQEIAAPVIAMLANETKSRQDEIWNKVTDAVKKYSNENGHVKLSNECICIVGRK
jgi:hypothetical protein